MTGTHRSAREDIHAELALGQHGLDGGAGAEHLQTPDPERLHYLEEQVRTAAARRLFAPEIVLIVATDEAGGIGFDGKIPWHSPSDLARFRRLTSRHLMVIGRKTHEAIGRILPGRTTAVLSRKDKFDGTLTLSHPDELLPVAMRRQETRVFVAGGGEVYAMFIDRADRIERTVIGGSFPCDTRFAFDLADGYDLAVERPHHDAGYSVSFQTWLRKRR